MKKIIALLILIVLSGCLQTADYQRSFLLMGTIVNIKTPDSIFANNAVNKAIARMKELELKFNRFDEKGEVYKINRGPKVGKIKISEELGDVLDASFYLNRISSGTFDVTIPPLMKLWGLYSREISKLPDKNQIDEALNFVGMQKIIFDKKTNTIEFIIPGMELDFSAIAKGYIVDEAIKVLKKEGVHSAIIEAGGDLYCLGDNRGRAWSVGIKDPKSKKKIIAKIKIRDKAIATSGGYENFVVIDGKRYPHIVDPRTGMPVDNNILSVTIVSNDCTTADGLATAISLLKPEEGLALVEKLEGVDCVIIYQEKDRLGFLISSRITDEIEIL